MSLFRKTFQPVVSSLFRKHGANGLNTLFRKGGINANNIGRNISNVARPVDKVLNSSGLEHVANLTGQNQLLDRAKLVSGVAKYTGSALEKSKPIKKQDVLSFR
jgi:hypothetical protein